MRSFVSLLGCTALVLAGCTSGDSGSASGTYRVEKIKSSGTGAGGESPVQIKLTSSGNLSEADLGSIISYVKIVAKREATKQQAALARQRALAVLAKMSPAQRAKTRYIAVETLRSSLNFQSQPAIILEGSSGGGVPKFDRSVMIFDSQNSVLVGNTVYDIQKAPPVGTMAKFESVNAVYVGAGI